MAAMHENSVVIMTRPFRPRNTAARRAGLSASQMVGVALCRYVLRLPPVVALGREEVLRWVGPTVQRYLTASR